MNLRSQTTKASAANKGLATQLQSQSQDEINPSTPQNKQRGPNSADISIPTDLLLSSVPDEVLVQIATRLEFSDLCRLSSVSKKWQNVVEGCSDHWRSLFQRAYCIPGIPVSPVQHRAAELATSWKKLYRSRFLAEADVTPWEKSSPFEIQAAIEQMYITNNITTTDQQRKAQENQIEEETCIIFLVDGSGSVTEDDFNSMTSFMITTADLIKSTKQGRQLIYLGVIQFSNEVKVELFPESINKSVSKIENKNGGGGGENEDENSAESEDYTPFHSAVESMVRINGGTNIAAAIQKAGQLFKTLATTPTTTTVAGDAENSSTITAPVITKNLRKVIALLTDGRIDSFQANQAKEITARLVDEQGNVEVHAFGVGRGVDRVELLKIIGGACLVGEEAENRYLPLMVMEDAPW